MMVCFGCTLTPSLNMTDVSSYSEIANEQLDEIEASGDAKLDGNILVICDFILGHPADT